MKICKRCLGEIHPERAALGFLSCVKCASTVSEFTKYRGVMRGSGAIQVMSTEAFTERKEMVEHAARISAFRRGKVR